MENKKCKICQHSIEYIFNQTVMNKYDVAYFQCKNCDFIQTEEPYWLDKAYEKSITDQDVGLVQRNIQLVKFVKRILVKNFDVNAKFLDWGGGYGLFTRLMRDEGFDFFHYDPICDNIFARGLQGKESHYELITCFEVFEHLTDPLKAFDEIFSLSKSLLFSEELIPMSKLKNWWYLAPEHGQHISFYSKKTLEYIAHNMDLILCLETVSI